MDENKFNYTETDKARTSNAWLQPLIYGVLLGLGILAGYFLKKPEQGKFDELITIVKKNYVDTVDFAKLEKNAFSNFLKTLDPHSTFIPAEEVKAASESLEGNFEGIGVEFNIFRDTVVILNVIAGGPSEKAGLKPGDKIINADGKDVAGKGIREPEIVKLLKGPSKSIVTIKVKRKGEKSLLSYDVRRGIIPLLSVDAGYMIDNHTGYIKLNRFSAATEKEFRDMVARLKDQGLERLILDLRDNPGGYLTTATALLDAFLEKDKLMLYTEGSKSRKVNYYSTGGGEFENGLLVILINENSASASEIVAGALQDHDRALIIGRRTYGKGLVQEPFYLGDGSLVRLTIARYYTPSGRCIQKPYKEGSLEYELEISNRYNNGELQFDSVYSRNDSDFYKTVNGRKVYGGGGVKPDLFVAMDTGAMPMLIRKGFRAGLFKFFIAEYPEYFAEAHSKYKDYRSFANNYKMPEELMEKFRSFASSCGVEMSQEQLRQHHNQIEKQIKAMLGRQWYGMEAYYFVMNQDDRMIRTAVENFSRAQALLRP